MLITRDRCLLRSSHSLRTTSKTLLGFAPVVPLMAFILASRCLLAAPLYREAPGTLPQGNGNRLNISDRRPALTRACTSSGFAKSGSSRRICRSPSRATASCTKRKRPRGVHPEARIARHADQRAAPEQRTAQISEVYPRAQALCEKRPPGRTVRLLREDYAWSERSPGPSWRRVFMKSRTVRAASGSRPLVGSSRKTTGGSWSSALAMASFCLIPLEKLPPGRRGGPKVRGGADSARPGRGQPPRAVRTAPRRRPGSA